MKTHATTARHWQHVDAQRERRARHRRRALKAGEVAALQIEAIATRRDLKPLPAGAADRDIQAHADRLAETMRRELEGIDPKGSPVAGLLALNAALAGLQCRPFAFRCAATAPPMPAQLAGFLRRARAPEWWRRQLRRAVVRQTEAEAIQAGRVSARARTWYVTDETLMRRQRQHKRNAAIMAATELENEAGQVFTVAQLAALGTGNKAIRRGELMTRIRGCEEWADANEHPGVFLTLTTPSRFHQHTSRTGGLNPAYRGATPRDGQDWLCATWAKCRAAMKRAEVSVYGFRVAEPHQDGTPHWHALLWADTPEALGKFEAIARRYWLADCGDEPGASEHRFKAKPMRPGEASGYVAKYIAKNIDDAGAVGVDGHLDDDFGEAFTLKGSGLRRTPQGELFDNPAARVEAWAGAWGIRQFQAIGQPPVTVWRELRRVEAEAADAAPVRVSMAWDGVHRQGEQRACWATFLDLQGGPCTGREYLIRLAKLRATHEGRYETVEVAKPVGVYAAEAPDALVPSKRSQWRPRGARGAAGPGVGVQGAPAVRQDAPRGPKARAPWTRLNNCTRGNFGSVVADLLHRLAESRPVPFSELNGGVHSMKADHEPFRPPPKHEHPF